ncbi:hypothetical protein [Pseudomonas synxantha]|uniref:hypothetical protein n=1 Tax=Pseudomonas synxantha TaxID=47883 RepID=UPI00345CDA96
MEVLTYVQIASILTYIGSLFYIYMVFIKAKDATIEGLRDRVAYQTETIKELKSVAPDVIVDLYIRRSEEYKKTLIDTESHRSELLVEIEGLKASGNAVQEGRVVELEGQVSTASALAEEVARERDKLQRKLKEIEESLSSYVKNGIVGISPGRQIFIAQVINYLGVERVVEASAQSMVKMFAKFVEESDRGLHQQMIYQTYKFPLETAGVLDRQGQLTQEGVQVFQKIALDIQLYGNKYR